MTFLGRSIIVKKGDGSQVKESTDSSTTLEDDDIKGIKHVSVCPSCALLFHEFYLVFMVHKSFPNGRFLCRKCCCLPHVYSIILISIYHWFIWYWTREIASQTLELWKLSECGPVHYFMALHGITLIICLCTECLQLLSNFFWI